MRIPVESLICNISMCTVDHVKGILVNEIRSSTGRTKTPANWLNLINRSAYISTPRGDIPPEEFVTNAAESYLGKPLREPLLSEEYIKQGESNGKTAHYMPFLCPKHICRKHVGINEPLNTVVCPFFFIRKPRTRMVITMDNRSLLAPRNYQSSFVDAKLLSCASTRECNYPPPPLKLPQRQRMSMKAWTLQKRFGLHGKQLERRLSAPNWGRRQWSSYDKLKATCPTLD